MTNSLPSRKPAIDESSASGIQALVKYLTTTHEQNAKRRESSSGLQAATTKAVKVTHATSRLPWAASAFSPAFRGRVLRGPGAVQKVNSDELIGWYAEGQTAGRPAAQLPIQAYLQKLENAYYQQLSATVPRKVTNAFLFARSAAKRRQDARGPKIVAQYRALVEQGMSRIHRVSQIAKTQGCSRDYVREVLREHGIRLIAPRRSR